MPDSKPDLLQGTLDMLILQTLAIQPNHGYGIGQRIRQVSRDALHVQQGSLYPALHRLEERGLVTAGWRETEGGRMAKFYSLTRSGRKRLEAEKGNWSRVSTAIALILAEEA